MDFAKNILSKYGWQDGDGLGKDKQGIKKPIKANLKFDSAGLGAEPGAEFGNNWWERCFNDAAQNVQVQKEQNGDVIVDLKDADNSVEVSTKNYSVKKLKNSGDGVYSNNFLSSDVSVASFSMTKYKVLSDAELFQACGGRTAHKGARHGLKLSGKLARLEQQEKELLAKMQKNKANKKENKTIIENGKSVATVQIEEKTKSKKKKKHIDENQTESVETSIFENALLKEGDEPEVKKKKKKRKYKEEDSNMCEEINEKSLEHKKSTKVVNDEDEQPECEADQPQKKKKKKRKHTEQLD